MLSTKKRNPLLLRLERAYNSLYHYSEANAAARARATRGRVEHLVSVSIKVSSWGGEGRGGEGRGVGGRVMSHFFPLHDPCSYVTLSLCCCSLLIAIVLICSTALLPLLLCP